MPLLVLEGADGSGKSTLAAKLLKGTGHPTLLVKRSGPPGSIETLGFMSKWLADQADSGLNIIADRHPIVSECIYRPVVRKAGDAPWTLEEVVEACKDKDILWIYCRPSYQTMRESASVEEQMSGVHDYYPALVDEYDRWFQAFEDHRLDVYVHNFDYDPTCRGAIAKVKSFWGKHRG